MIDRIETITPDHFRVGAGRASQHDTMLFGQSGAARRQGGARHSPFVGRHDDNGLDGTEPIRDIRLIHDNYRYETELLAA